jgi:hypothetical protein
LEKPKNSWFYPMKPPLLSSGSVQFGQQSLYQEGSGARQFIHTFINRACSYAGMTNWEPFFANIMARNFAGFVELAFRLTSWVLPGGS